MKLKRNPADEANKPASLLLSLFSYPIMYLSCGRGTVWNAINKFIIIIIIIMFVAIEQTLRVAGED
jgi:hypothetical protein